MRIGFDWLVLLLGFILKQKSGTPGHNHDLIKSKPDPDPAERSD